MARPVEDVPRWSDFDDPPGVHDRDIVACHPCHADVMRDEKQCHVELTLQHGEQPENLRLDRHVKRRRGFVGH
jgi:hypothetical protein